MKKARLGSVIRTQDNTLWYCCGSWCLDEAPNSYPCMLGYIPEDQFPPELEKIKTITVRGRSYVKVFGHYGQSLDIHRTVLMKSRREMVHPVSLGRLFFVKKESIAAVQDPRAYVSTFLQAMEGASELFASLVDILGISLKDFGVSGSTLVIEVPSWRHEIDFVVYGYDQCRKTCRAIQQHRDDSVFSKAALPPYHLPFRYQDKWFDPQYCEADQERHFLHGASVTMVKSLKRQNAYGSR